MNYVGMEVARSGKEIDARNRGILQRVDRMKRKPKIGLACIGIAEETIGLRQCAMLCRIAEETKSRIRVVSNGQSTETADGILGLMKLHISKGTLVVISIRHGDEATAYVKCRSVMGFSAS